MSALRASFSIEPDILRSFNALFPAGERSKVVEKMMQQALIKKQSDLAKALQEFETHDDFKEARETAKAFEQATFADGLKGIAPL